MKCAVAVAAATPLRALFCLVRCVVIGAIVGKLFRQSLSLLVVPHSCSAAYVAFVSAYRCIVVVLMLR